MKVKSTQTRSDEQFTVFDGDNFCSQNDVTFNCEKNGCMMLGRKSSISSSKIHIAEGARLEIAEGAIIKDCNISIRTPGAVFRIGRFFSAFESKIFCDESIEIGEFVRIGPKCLVADSQIHSTDKEERRAEAIAIRQKKRIIPKDYGIKTLPLKIGDDCQISCGAVIVFPAGGDNLEKMVIASGTRVGANAVVKHPVLQPNSTVVKAPARVI